MNSITHAKAVFKTPGSARTEFVGEYLRSKSPDVVSKEILMRFLAYDLLRALMWQAAETHHRPLHRLSFAGTMQHFEAVAPYLCLFAGTSQGRPSTSYCCPGSPMTPSATASVAWNPARSNADPSHTSSSTAPEMRCAKL